MLFILFFGSCLQRKKQKEKGAELHARTSGDDSSYNRCKEALDSHFGNVEAPKLSFKDLRLNPEAVIVSTDSYTDASRSLNIYVNSSEIGSGNKSILGTRADISTIFIAWKVCNIETQLCRKDGVYSKSYTFDIANIAGFPLGDLSIEVKACVDNLDFLDTSARAQVVDDCEGQESPCYCGEGATLEYKSEDDLSLLDVDFFNSAFRLKEEEARLYELAYSYAETARGHVKSCSPSNEDPTMKYAKNIANYSAKELASLTLSYGDDLRAVMYDLSRQSFSSLALEEESTSCLIELSSQDEFDFRGVFDGDQDIFEQEFIDDSSEEEEETLDELSDLDESSILEEKTKLVLGLGLSGIMTSYILTEKFGYQASYDFSLDNRVLGGGPVGLFAAEGTGQSGGGTTGPPISQIDRQSTGVNTDTSQSTAEAQTVHNELKPKGKESNVDTDSQQKKQDIEEQKINDAVKAQSQKQLDYVDQAKKQNAEAQKDLESEAKAPGTDEDFEKKRLEAEKRKLEARGKKVEAASKRNFEAVKTHAEEELKAAQEEIDLIKERADKILENDKELAKKKTEKLEAEKELEIVGKKGIPAIEAEKLHKQIEENKKSLEKSKNNVENARGTFNNTYTSDFQAKADEAIREYDQQLIWSRSAESSGFGEADNSAYAEPPEPLSQEYEKYRRDRDDLHKDESKYKQDQNKEIELNKKWESFDEEYHKAEKRQEMINDYSEARNKYGAASSRLYFHERGTEFRDLNNSMWELEKQKKVIDDQIRRTNSVLGSQYKTGNTPRPSNFSASSASSTSSRFSSSSADFRGSYGGASRSSEPNLRTIGDGGESFETPRGIGGVPEVPGGVDVPKTSGGFNFKMGAMGAAGVGAIIIGGMYAGGVFLEGSCKNFSSVILDKETRLYYQAKKVNELKEKVRQAKLKTLE